MTYKSRSEDLVATFEYSVDQSLHLLEQLEEVDKRLREWPGLDARQTPVAEDVEEALAYEELRKEKADYEGEMTTLASELIEDGFPMAIWVRFGNHRLMVDYITSIVGNRLAQKPRIRIKKWPKS